MIGDADMAQRRNYLYTLKSKTMNSSLYLISKEDFMKHIVQNERDMSFRKFVLEG